jgi:hypothetical protein
MGQFKNLEMSGLYDNGWGVSKGVFNRGLQIADCEMKGQRIEKLQDAPCTQCNAGQNANLKN